MNGKQARKLRKIIYNGKKIPANYFERTYTENPRYTDGFNLSKADNVTRFAVEERGYYLDLKKAFVQLNHKQKSNPSKLMESDNE